MEITNSDLTKIFDIAFENPDFIFTISSEHIKDVKKFVKEHAYVKSFGWIPEERHVFKYGDLIHFETMTMRNECGYLESCSEHHNDFHCQYAIDEWSDDCDCGKRICRSYNCPIASNNPHKNVLEENDLADQYEYDSEGYSEDCDWMELYTRPKDAAVNNVFINE